MIIRRGTRSTPKSCRGTTPRVFLGAPATLRDRTMIIFRRVVTTRRRVTILVDAEDAERKLARLLRVIAIQDAKRFYGQVDRDRFFAELGRRLDERDSDRLLYGEGHAAD
jgi:hypothetical protein